MYLIIIVIMAVLTLEVLLEEEVIGFRRGANATLLANLINASLFGLFGNSLYLWHAERKMRKLMALNLPREELLVRLRRAGGTSWTALLVLLGGVALSVGAYYWYRHT